MITRIIDYFNNRSVRKNIREQMRDGKTKQEIAEILSSWGECTLYFYGVRFVKKHNLLNNCVSESCEDCIMTAINKRFNKENHND